MKEHLQDTASMDALMDEAVTVAASLQALNETLDQQRRSIADLCGQLMHTTINLTALARAIRAGDKQPKTAGDGAKAGNSVTAEAARQEAMAAADAVTLDAATMPEVNTATDVPAGPEVRAALVKAYENTLAAQVQLNTIADAALTQGIAVLYAEIESALEQGDARHRPKKSVGAEPKSTR